MKLKLLGGFVAMMTLAASCVDVNERLGEELIPDNQNYTFYTTTIDIDDMRMEMADSLSGYNLYRITFGAIRDEGVFGLTRRTSAFYIVPVADTLDYGKPGTQKFKAFHLAAPYDSVSCQKLDQVNILQNVNVYALDKPMNLAQGAPELVYDKTKRITRGVPVCNGLDSLSLDFTEDFAKKYLTITQEELDSLPLYLKRFPGIVISTDDPAGEGGRINMFKLPIAVTSGSITGSYANLKFSAEYDGEVKDTSFVFYLGPASKYDMASVTSTSISSYPQIAYTLSEHSSKDMAGSVTDVAYFEGGRGLKPVIKAKSIRDKLAAEITLNHGNPKTAVINKAYLELPFEFPDDYVDMRYFPTTMSPTTRIVGDDGTETFVGITDASISDEDPGNINRSLLKYTPYVTYHLQQMLRLEDESKIENYDIWFLAMADETITSSSSSSSDLSEYYQQMAYASYYNSMYGGYGYGYGSGYGYSSYYNNYYNYMMMASMMNSSSTTTSTQSVLDANRYYCGRLNGPAAARRPKLKVIYAVPHEE
ncbi:MAG: hypothetical protein IJ151_03015 [Bacteroidales bacterium]|nr:hypothetical protein [Bacteroidales bacterium]